MKKKVIVYEGNVEYLYSMKLIKFIDFWTTKLYDIPDEFKDITNVDIKYSMWGMDCTISYEREETYDEQTARELKEAEEYERIKRQDLMRYEQIKEQYNL